VACDGCTAQLQQHDDGPGEHDQRLACVPNFPITEYFVNFEAMGRKVAKNTFVVKDGYIDLPTTPGLGIELDEAALLRHKATGERRPRHIRTYDEEA
jgi:hypothetical protein